MSSAAGINLKNKPILASEGSYHNFAPLFIPTYPDTK